MFQLATSLNKQANEKIFSKTRAVVVTTILVACDTTGMTVWFAANFTLLPGNFQKNAVLRKKIQ